MDLDEVAAELYDAAPEDFTRLRKEQIDAARAAGDRELAKQINQLRRPTRSAWIVNLLAGQAAEEVSGLLDLGAALADAQQRLSGKELRELSSQRHSVISSLVKRGSQLAQVRGHTPTEATLREVSDTLQAALSDPQIAEQVRSGRLATAQEYGGFGPELLLSMSAPPAAKKQSAGREERDEGGHEGGDQAGDDRAADDRAEDDRAEDDHGDADQAGGAAEDDHDEAEHQRLVQDLNTAQVALDRIRAKATGTTERLEKATEAVAYRTERVQDLQDQLKRAERELAKAHEQLDKLTGQQDELRDAEKAAEQAVSTALSRLADG
jgi:hypothetical protein